MNAKRLKISKLQNFKTSKFIYMKKRYVFLSAIAIIFGIIVAVLPAKDVKNEIQPEQMLLEILDETRFLSVDKVAEYIVEQNRFVLLIDVRTPEKYAEWTLPGAINIPFDSILNPSYEYILNQDVYTNVLFSNGSVYSSQSWILLKRKGFSNNYVLDGGLNKFIETFFMMKKPKIEDPNEVKDLYQFRKGVRQYFTGSGDEGSSDNTKTEVKVIIKKDKNKEDEGGC